jgi:hypothetical protein
MHSKIVHIKLALTTHPENYLMATTSSFIGSLLTVGDLFFKPFYQHFSSLDNRHHCPAFDDELWFRAGIERIIEGLPSGRAFLQEYAPQWDEIPSHSNYFESFKSSRRADMAQEMNLKILAQAEHSLEDRLADMEELTDYEVFALDGHWHKGAIHDPKRSGKKDSTGHFYSLNLRYDTLRDLAVNAYSKEHDMHVLKRLKPTGLRQGVERGRRVLIVYDKAAIDFKYWKRCKKETAVYFLSRVKEGMVFEILEEREWDKKDQRNAGVLSDQRRHTKDNIDVRVVKYRDPESGEEFEFLTNVMDVQPGTIVELYRRRWTIEKVYDDLKNKLFQKRAWSSDQEGKRAQGQLIAITYNLIRLTEEHLEIQHEITNVAEDKRRKKRKVQLCWKSEKKGQLVSSLRLGATRATQRSVKFIRWLRVSMRKQLTVPAAAAHLKASYAKL